MNAVPRFQASSCRYGRTIERCPPKWICLLPARPMIQKTTRYVYQIELPEVDGLRNGRRCGQWLLRPKARAKHEHGGVIPTSAVTFDETDVTFFVLKERERVWGTEYYVEECHAAAEEVAGGQVALTYFPNGGQVSMKPVSPLKNGMAVRLEK